MQRRFVDHYSGYKHVFWKRRSSMQKKMMAMWHSLRRRGLPEDVIRSIVQRYYDDFDENPPDEDVHPRYPKYYYPRTHLSGYKQEGHFHGGHWSD